MSKHAAIKNPALLDSWRSAWEDALSIWSKYTKLGEPRWCFTEAEEKKENLSDSFAMIRLIDHAVVISLRQVEEKHLEDFAAEILAHEIGHHVFAPADLADNARLIARIRANIPSRETYVGMISNLYTDLLINDRLQRQAGLDMAGIYKKLKVDSNDKLWTLYMRIYEILWKLDRGTLTQLGADEQLEFDASLGAKLIRVYAKDWLHGAGGFAALFLPYLLEYPDNKIAVAIPWMDSDKAGAGDVIPDGIAEMDEDEGNARHPSMDERITGINEADEGEETLPGKGGGKATLGGKKNNYRSPTEYVEVMKAMGVSIAENLMVIKYYKERARPHLIKYPVRETRESTDPLPEGLDAWDPGESLAEVDWIETVTRNPVVIPGVTTLKRLYGVSPGNTPEKEPLDLYIGVDCSGSMLNPAMQFSPPVLAGTIMALSALRASAKVMVTLSGEPGSYSSTNDFLRNENDILSILTGYLGTGYAFGILRLKDAFLNEKTRKRPAHIIVVTDTDIFHMLKEVKTGWDIARDALEAAGGGGTFLLHCAPTKMADGLMNIGWNVHYIVDWNDIIAFARAFSKMHYEK